MASGGNPFVGGSITRTGQANVAGSIAPASTGVGNPVGGVNPGAIFTARNNSGSNIGIPYTRLVPLGSGTGSGLGPPPPSAKNRHADARARNSVLTETENLHSMTLAFILGKRSAYGYTTMYAPDDDTSMYDVDYGSSFAVNSAMAPGMAGTERFQKLCSIEYLERYFTNCLWTKGIVLTDTVHNQKDNRGIEGGTLLGKIRDIEKVGRDPAYMTGLPRMVLTASVERQRLRQDAGGTPEVLDKTVGVDFGLLIHESTLTNVKDFGRAMGLPNSEAARAHEIHQGIFTRDMGPFFRGKGITHEMLAGTASGGVLHNTAPYQVSRCTGDEMAFALFENLLEQKGFTDWRPDGIVLSKGVDDPSDKMSDEMLKSRDGELFNIRIQGPAITSSWTGDPALEAMPLDKVFVVIVADVWWGALDGSLDVARGGTCGEEVRNFVNSVAPLKDAAGAFSTPAGVKIDSTLLRGYMEGREKELDGRYNGRGLRKIPAPKKKNGDAYNKRPTKETKASTDPRPTPEEAGNRWDQELTRDQTQYDKYELYAQFAKDAEEAYKKGTEITRLTNFRVRLATSSQMVNYSHPRFDSDGQQVCSTVHGDQYRRVHGESRMGLRLGMHGGEYIVGGWCIGSVLDTAASRAAFPSAGSNIGVRTAPNSMAMNLAVKVEWWDADRMWRCFMNIDESITPRYIRTKPLLSFDIDSHVPSVLYTAPNMPPATALTLRKTYTELDKNEDHKKRAIVENILRPENRAIVAKIISPENIAKYEAFLVKLNEAKDALKIAETRMNMLPMEQTEILEIQKYNVQLSALMTTLDALLKQKNSLGDELSRAKDEKEAAVQASDAEAQTVANDQIARLSPQYNIVLDNYQIAAKEWQKELSNIQNELKEESKERVNEAKENVKITEDEVDSSIKTVWVVAVERLFPCWALRA